ncbi:GNAT family N-acetyltransferase [Paenibacillus hubeiensis]|uniref:GNAT family N-acetyltransferase n=1 Tax=Paenibacillus hubeiensis TaxID=3077330 RepID=UPI0031BA7C3C
MIHHQVIPMKYDNGAQINDIVALEQQCKQLDSAYLKADLEHLTKEDGDHGLLCYNNGQLVGLLSWYPSEGTTGSINAVVHPQYRRQGVFHSLLERAREDMRPLGIHQLSYRVPQSHPAGPASAHALGAAYDRSEYAMKLQNDAPAKQSQTVLSSGLALTTAEPEDLEFMIACSSAAFGDPEDWTRGYFRHTDEPSRPTYVIRKENERVGLIRVNVINDSTGFIHNFCILPARQGEKLGRAALTLMVHRLLEQGYADIRLSVVTENERALSLYRSVGFDVTTENKYFIGPI